MLPLSPTEKRVLELFDQGFEYKEIGVQLACSPNTVKTYCKRIVTKTMATSMRNAAWLRRQPLTHSGAVMPALRR